MDLTNRELEILCKFISLSVKKHEFYDFNEVEIKQLIKKIIVYRTQKIIEDEN